MKPAPLLSRPRLQREDLKYLKAYRTCDNSRQAGASGPCAIPLSEVSAYCDLAGIDTQRERLRVTELVQRLDALYLEAWADKQPSK